ncbi:Peroxiredoxin family protein/glutaredoxin [Thioalkalivibrio nitratireducens DSM 14787]|uniref:Peroxiredoxin family protein/glutaredoxin n=1 Tax=Thioalkalivibrio nitratireducens (strain DSM 14787 / UNIQEM 213 / ALEN2) TaxID=1255043 RepID=L0DU02_THIND|nr:glutathione peroxidase [Thioalkalivibrio nitratireducens]AGA32498.1 Peroxiredoxin family protein/glutaredoxin [Thioalkalivibrio nitratireducens DSM 14787]
MTLQAREGQRVPEVTFRCRKDNEWNDIRSADIFKGRNVVVFALPGAFTPTCSSAHVPRYNELAPVLKAQGIDEIVCISVNDGFVMEAWQADQCAERITFIADGNGEFTDAMGMLVDKSDLGFGKRSWRYSMLVRDGVIEKQFIEPDEPGDPFVVSDADTMLEYLAPNAARPKDVVLFTKPGCPYCKAAKDDLQQASMDFEEIVLGRDASLRSLRAATGAMTVPQVFVNGERIGGSEELKVWLDRARIRPAA